MKRRAIASAIAAVSSSLAVTLIAPFSAAQEGGLEEIVVTARKQTESLQDVGIAVSAMSQTEIERTFARDLTDLEYDLLFLWKDSSEYGIDLWNGVYYQLEVSDDGRIRGLLHEMDMNILSAPPEDGNMRPIHDNDLEPGEAESHWLPILVIE